MSNSKKIAQTSIKKNYIYNTIYQVLSLITPLITAPYISRVLGSSGVGIYSYTNSIVTYFTLFAALGTASYGQREIAMHRNDSKASSKLFWEIEFLSITTTAVSNTHPEQYAEDPIGTIMTNIYGCDNLLKLAVEKKARFLLASSVEIYGQGTAIPMNEEYCGYIDCNLARSGYNEAKRTCEALTQSYRSVFGVNAVIARFARVFGADKKHDTKAMSQFMDKAVLGEDIILKSKGQQRYSYCYIADAVSGLLKLLLDGQDGEAYNISNDDDGLTLGEYAEYIASLANLKVRYEIENNESVSKATFALLDTHKIKNIGWKPQYSVKDGLKRTYMIKKEQLTNVD